MHIFWKKVREHLSNDLTELPGQAVCVIDVNIARVHNSDNVSARRCNHKATDAVVKATDIKQMCKRADINESNDAVLT